MKFFKNQLLLYVITDRMSQPIPLAEQVRQALQGGATAVQLREKELNGERLLHEAFEVKKVCREFGVPFIVNDSFELAIKCQADGVHVGIGDEPVAEIRKKAPKGFIIGATAKTVTQAIAAQAAGADYLGVGALFPSITKPDAVRITKEKLKEICAAVQIPVVAIGGITRFNLEELKGSGMSGFAFVSAVFAENDICAATRILKTKCEELLHDC